MDDRLKQTRNLFRKLIRDNKSVFYAVDRISKTLLSKAKKSLYEKDKIFYKYYSNFENKNILYERDDAPKKKSVSFYTPFVEQRKDIDRLPALYSIKDPFEYFHADIANIHFFSKSAVNPKYCLVVVDLFTPKIYT